MSQSNTYPEFYAYEKYRHTLKLCINRRYAYINVYTDLYIPACVCVCVEHEG